MTSGNFVIQSALPAFVAVQVFAASAAAQLFIFTTSRVPTPGLPGYGTYTVTVGTTIGEPIQGFDFASQAEFGFFGPMNQVNPGGLATIFEDNNAFFPSTGADVFQDSQFKFVSSDVTLPHGFASESATQLRAVFSAPSPLGTSVPFVQLVIPPLSSVHAFGQILIASGIGDYDTEVEFTIANYSPEPSTLILFGLVTLTICSFVRRR